MIVALSACTGPVADDTGEGDDDVVADVADAAPPAAEPSRIVVLIPGTLITGDFYDSMAARLTVDGFEPVVFVPPDLFTESLATGAARIDAFVDELRAARGVDRVNVIAECDGGVATRYWLQRLGGAEHVEHAITFVSAHHGTVLSPIGEWVTGYQALADITPGSPFLQELDAAPFPPGLELTSIYSCWDEVIQPASTSRVDGATNVEFCAYYLGHFDGFWDPLVYERMLAALRGGTATAPTEY